MPDRRHGRESSCRAQALTGRNAPEIVVTRTIKPDKLDACSGIERFDPTRQKDLTAPDRFRCGQDPPIAA